VQIPCFLWAQVYTARMYQAIPSGLDLFWLSSSLGAASLDECGIFNDESRAERLLPMGSPLEGKGAKLDDGYDFSCGNFEIFDSVCQACFEQVKFTSRMPGMGNQTQSVVPLRFWIMNTWACNVGPAVLPWHRDEMQVGNKVRQDNLNAGETLVPGAHWTQTYGLRSMDTDTREIREGTQEERARGGKSPGESRELLQVKYQTLPGNATDWLLYNRQLSIPENYLMSGILASNDSKCQRLGFVDARTHVSPSYVKELDSCEAEGCVTCPRDFLCASFLMIPHIYDRIYAEKERLLNQSVITWLPTSVFRCVGCGKFRGYQVANGECVDRDECITNSHDCHETNVCINTVGSFECQCKRGFESKGIGSEAGQSCVTCPRVCEDMDECLESRFYAGETSTLPPINCGRNGKCTNTHGSYFCECVTDGFESVYSDFGAHSCASKSTVVFEHAWMVGNKIGFFVSWDIKQAPHPQDVISIETETILSTPECDEYVQLFTPELCPKPEWGKLSCVFVVLVQLSAQVSSNITNTHACTRESCARQGERRTVYWMYAGNAGCGSQLSLMVGSSGVMACQVRPNNTQAWASQVIQQKSTGPGMYYVRVFSYSAQEIVAQDGKLYTSDNIPGLELPADGGALAWPGGLTSCKPPSGMTDPWALGATDCQTVLVLTLIEGEIPVVQDESIPTRCGDGKLSPSNNEQCDDGNDIKGDGCDDACVIEINSACSYKSNDNVTSWSQEVSPGESVLMYQWVPGESTCERRKCGDGKINLDGEQCDDGLLLSCTSFFARYPLLTSDPFPKIMQGISSTWTDVIQNVKLNVDLIVCTLLEWIRRRIRQKKCTRKFASLLFSS
jgi:cysteine-rich repeat protein